MRSSAAEHTPDSGHTRVEQVVRLVLYFDVFRHPLRVDELAALAGDVESSLAEATESGLLERDGRWVFRPGRGGDRPARLARAAEAERQWPRARRAAAFLALVPFVRGVLVTGGLSKQSATPHDDIDFLLLVEPGRVWTVKAGLHALRRGLPPSLRDSLCTNYILATDQLVLPQRSMFHAIELATAVPMYGPDVCARFLSQNAWITDRVPGWAFALDRANAAPSPARSPWQSRLERAIPSATEAQAAAALSNFWNRRYAWLSDDERQRRFQRGPGVATNHLHDFSGWVNTEYAARCEAAGVPE